MAVDVRLDRVGREPWGFEMAGGADEEAPLRVDQVIEDSPAHRAGMLCGDMILNINGAEAIDMSLDAAKKMVDGCGDRLILGVMRGLYDPVLDDQEPIYETCEPDALDQPSEPTEVPFSIQQFTDAPDLLKFLEPPELGGPPFSESRSLTSSPFPAPTKPYRPFSTEPIPVPPIEDPIILNPDYKDNFGRNSEEYNPDDLLSAYYEDAFGYLTQETRFKLPISKQYDPDGSKSKSDTNVSDDLFKRTGDNVTKSDQSEKKAFNDAKSTEIKENNAFTHVTDTETTMENSKIDVDITQTSQDVISEQMIREELNYMVKMKQEIDLDKIEETALLVVNENIERAVSVAKEIKKEMDEEIIITSERKESQTKLLSESNNSSEQKEEIVETENDTKSESKKYQEEVTEQLTKNEKLEQQEYTDDPDTSKVKSVVSKEGEEQVIYENNVDERRSSKSFQSKSEKHVGRTSVQIENKDESRNETVYNVRDASVDHNAAEQRVYSLGLQTIPNIRGVVHSSYQYDLLLKTFFIHLTDVMVALSRFILTQPVFNTDKTELNCHGSISHTKHETRVKSQEQAQTTQESQSQNKMVQRDSKLIQSNQQNKVESNVTPQTIVETNNIKNQETFKSQSNTTEKKIIIGATMAQMSEKKFSQDLTQKMDAVVAEFQTKANADPVDMLEIRKETIQQNRRSRSRSQVEEEVMRENDPLEWLAKADSRRASQERTTEVSQNEFCSTSIESLQKKKHETSNEKPHTKKFKSPKQTYVAIVEAHVYTNKDVIFEEQVTELSETSSVQSADEVNTAFEAFEAETSEKVTIENAIKELETAQVQKSHELERENIKNEATAQIIAAHDSEEINSARQSDNIQQKELRNDFNDSLSVATTQEIKIGDSKQEFTSIQHKVGEAITVIEENNKEFAATSELISDNFIDVAKEREIIEKEHEIIKPEYKIVEGENVSETVVIKELPEKKYAMDEEFAELKIVKHVDLDIETTNEIIEIEEVNEKAPAAERESNMQTVINKLEISKEINVDQHQQITEKSITSAQYGSGVKTLSNELVVKQKIEKELEAQKQSDLSTAVEIHSTSKACVNDFQSKSVVNKSQIEQSTDVKSKSSKDTLQKSSLTAKSVDHNLTIRTDLQAERQTSVQSDENNNIDTPTPSTVPPTPLVDEYIFKLSIPLPKSRSATPVPRDCTPPYDDDHEDPDIVKKRLIPHIETTIEQVIFDPPLPTPPGSKVSSPVYTKPGLIGGADRPEYHRNKRKEEIREIERKSSLLASAIDETIKSIEEYKEEVEIKRKKETEEYKSEIIKQESYREKTSKQNGFTEDNRFKQNSGESMETKEKIFEYNKNEAVLIEPQKESTEIQSNLIQESNKQIQQNDNFEYYNIESVAVDNANSTAAISVDLKYLTEQENVSISDAVTEFESNKNVAKLNITEPSQPTELLNITDSVGIEIESSKVEFDKSKKEVEKSESLPGFRPVVFDPDAIPKHIAQPTVVQLEVKPSLDGRQSPYVTESGEPIGTIQGIVDGLEEPVLDAEVAKELGKPGISEDTIAELISGEAEMLREAHVMGLARVLNSHMHRVDDSSVDFEKIKPMIGSLKDSEVLKALNEDLAKQRAEKKKEEERRWTTFLQKPKRNVPRPKYGYHGWVQHEEETVEEPYKVKIVKQPKPKVAPDYKPEDFETGPLPWEERQLIEASLPPVEPEEPILVPEVPEYLEAVDPTPESEVPDLEDTGIPLPPIPPEDPTPPPIITEELVPEVQEEVVEQRESVEERQEEKREDNMDNGLAEQLVRSVQSMVDPNATLEQQLCQMRAQLAALAQLPEVIQQTLELVSKQLTQITHQEASVEKNVSQAKNESYQEIEATENNTSYEESQNQVEAPTEYQNEANGVQENGQEEMITEEIVENGGEERPQGQQQNGVQEMMVEERKSEKQLKEQNPRQIRQRSAPRQCKPQPKFGPLDPDQRPVVLPGGRRWRNIEDVYNEQLIAETLQAQAELIQGKALGFESDLLPYNSSINFKKYEKPPVSLDHLQRSEVYKAVHDMDHTPLKRVEFLAPVMCEADYRERCRSMTPTPKQHLAIPQQFHP